MPLLAYRWSPVMDHQRAVESMLSLNTCSAQRCGLLLLWFKWMPVHDHEQWTTAPLSIVQEAPHI